jgi:methionyl aminopeptidase
MTIGSERDLLALLKVGRLCGLAMQYMARHLEPGITTAELDALGAAFLEKHGARPAPIISYQFPNATCISINEEVAHGIPGDRAVRAGDLVNIDVSAELDGYFADTGATFPVPPNTPQQLHLCATTREALDRAIGAARAGQPLNEIGRAVEALAKSSGFTIIRELNGHGIGHKLHEEPRNIPSHFTRRARQKMTEGMVMTIEPFFTTGGGRVVTAPDGWTLCTTDGSWTAQYEHTVVITKDRPILVTAV